MMRRCLQMAIFGLEKLCILEGLKSFIDLLRNYKLAEKLFMPTMTGAQSEHFLFFILVIEYVNRRSGFLDKKVL